MVILIILAYVILRFGFCISVFHLLMSIPYMFLDIVNYVRYKKWKIFNKFGLELFVGSFGKGKTLMAANYVISLKKRYPDVPLYSNITLKGVDYIPLNSFEQIVSINGQAIVFIDEMGVMFNSRDFGNFPLALLDNILQCRHLGLLIVGTAQKYEDVDIIIRKNISVVHEVRKLCARLIGLWNYDGYRVYYSKVDYHNIKPDSRGIYCCISNKMRRCYDTSELAVNITNVIDDESYDKRTEHSNNYISRYRKRYNSKKYST